MPTISIFFGIVVQMYWRDHAPAHFHAYYQGREALIEIATGDVLAGALPPAVRRILREWTMRHRFELIANWEKGRLRLPFEAIIGADEE